MTEIEQEKYVYRNTSSTVQSNCLISQGDTLHMLPMSLLHALKTLVHYRQRYNSRSNTFGNKSGMLMSVIAVSSTGILLQ